MLLRATWPWTPSGTGHPRLLWAIWSSEAFPWTPLLLGDVFVTFSSNKWESQPWDSKLGSAITAFHCPSAGAGSLLPRKLQKAKPCKPCFHKTLELPKCRRQEIVVLQWRSWRSLWVYAKSNQCKFGNLSWHTLTELQIKPITGRLFISYCVLVIVIVMH